MAAWMWYLAFGLLVLAGSSEAGRARKFYRDFRYNKPRRGREDTFNGKIQRGCTVVRLLSRINRKAQMFQDRRVSSIRLLRPFSDSRNCDRKVDYGFRGRTVFARNGCRGEFKVCFNDYYPRDYRGYGDNRGYGDYRGYSDYRGYNGYADYHDDYYGDDEQYNQFQFGGDNYGARCQRVILESWGPEQPAWKQLAGYQGYTTIELFQQWSNAPCILGQTFFSEGLKVMATNGCRGEFRVCIS